MLIFSNNDCNLMCVFECKYLIGINVLKTQARFFRTYGQNKKSPGESVKFVV